MDDEEEVTPHLQCEIKLEFSGPTGATLNKWAASVLRKLAERIENDQFESGHHDVMDSVGKRVGTIYLDHFGEM